MSAHPDTPTAQNAFIGIVNEPGMAIINREFSEELAETASLQADPEMTRDVLQFTTATPGAMGAVKSVRCHQELKTTFSHL